MHTRLFVLAATVGFGCASSTRTSQPASATSDRASNQTPAEQLALGQAVYTGTVGVLACTACHGPDGRGTPGVFPPLVGQAEHLGTCEDTARIILRGLSGPLVVDGILYQGTMPPQAALLDDVQIAAVATYIRTAWGNDYGPCTPQTVARVRD